MPGTPRAGPRPHPCRQGCAAVPAHPLESVNSAGKTAAARSSLGRWENCCDPHRFLRCGMSRCEEQLRDLEGRQSDLLHPPVWPPCPDPSAGLRDRDGATGKRRRENPATLSWGRKTQEQMRRLRGNNENAEWQKMFLPFSVPGRRSQGAAGRGRREGGNLPGGPRLPALRASKGKTFAGKDTLREKSLWLARQSPVTVQFPQTWPCHGAQAQAARGVVPPARPGVHRCSHPRASARPPPAQKLVSRDPSLPTFPSDVPPEALPGWTAHLTWPLRPPPRYLLCFCSQPFY
ncbi:uncharacterized protein LOC123632063 [Lemur catta]|uniref:uncharacterized protein LOC123632063 n=1 Tax=Lemur catta TaxID=9447 RepID=UPI001E26B37A|nr:uncharacterized protein LOC123632063 [Lemur catta]